MEEDPKEKKWSMSRVIIDSLGACMLITVLLDFWRLSIGNILGEKTIECLPWMAEYNH